MRVEIKKNNMSEASDPSDTEVSDKQDDKDTDFNVDDYSHEIESDDSFAESLENNVNVRPKCFNLFTFLLNSACFEF